jgi:serine/threonine protein kinase
LIHQSGHIRLIDFDLAKQCEKNLDEPKYKSHVLHFFKRDKQELEHAHQLHSFVGTAEYIAPEIITGYGYGASVDWWTVGILLYEMLFSITPFRGNSNNETFGRILHGHYEIPDSNAYGPISKACKDLLRKLIRSDATKRLGHLRGASDLKAHEFFRGVNFANLINERPPIQPEIKDIFDTTHFRGDLQPQSSDSGEETVRVVNDIEELNLGP